MRAALEVHTREALPQKWAGMQKDLSFTLFHQAAAASGLERARLLKETVAAARAGLGLAADGSSDLEWIDAAEAEIESLEAAAAGGK
jgi:hypothetical protein